jgi:hypothetical protein
MVLTPDQFNQLALKEDLKNLATKEEVRYFKDEVLTAVDKVVKKLDNIEVELASNLMAHDRFEKRITKLEKNNRQFKV